MNEFIKNNKIDTLIDDGMSELYKNYFELLVESKKIVIEDKEMTILEISKKIWTIEKQNITDIPQNKKYKIFLNCINQMKKIYNQKMYYKYLKTKNQINKDKCNETNLFINGIFFLTSLVLYYRPL